MNECIVCGTEFEVSNEVEENEIMDKITRPEVKPPH